ncbi:DNA polymerase III subunit alpha [Candidatus Vidania fulgoroideorum]
MIGNLKFYSEYSLEYGSLKIKELLKYCIKEKYKYICITDRFNISGSYEFFNIFYKAKIKPIIGCEIHVKISFGKILCYGNLTLIAQNNKGYVEICKILSYRKLQIKKYINIKKILKFKNIFILSGGYGGIYTSIIKKFSFCLLITNIIKKFNKNFYIEIQRFNDDSFKESNILINLSKKSNIPLVATHPIRYLKKKDNILHFYKYCILKKIYLSQIKKSIFENFYFLTKKEFISKFKDIKISIKNSNFISKKCLFKFNTKRKNLFLKKKNFYKKIKKLLNKKIKKFDKNKKNIYEKRFSYEYKIIKKKKFINYFIIVSDFVNWAKKKKIQVGPGRGSCSSSLISFLLNITEIDPISNKLIFERFLNVKKNSMPDFDIDFCKQKRKHVLEYVKNKYNKKKVIKLVTFGKFSFKNSFKDSGRILGYNYSYLNNLSNNIHFKKKYKNLKEILNDKNIILKYKNDKRFIKIIKISIKIDGFIRNIGIHAGGIVITKKKFFNYFPIYYLKRENDIVSQFNKYDIEKLGFLKFDFLGLNTLTILKYLIKITNINFSFLNLDYNDKKTFDLIKKGNTTGVFQLENENLKKYLKILKPQKFSEIVNIVSLYRPGPVSLINDYCNKSFKINLNILKETRGLIIFQEQLIKIIEKEYKIEINTADFYRTILAKGNQNEISELKKNIIKKYKNNKKIMYKKIELFNYIKKFSGYCFNKAHAVSYSTLTYSMAWFKANYKENFFLSNFNFCFKNNKKLENLYKDCIDNNILFLPPDINYSEKFFIKYSIFKKTKIITGFFFIKNIGKNAIHEIIYERKKNGFFKNFPNFLYRIKKKIVNSRIIKNLIYSGCFDNIDIREKIINDFYYNKNNINQLILIKKKIKKKINIFQKEKKTIYFFYSDINRYFYIKKKKNIFLGLIKKSFYKNKIIIENNYMKCCYFNYKNKVNESIAVISFLKKIKFNRSEKYIKKICFL